MKRTAVLHKWDILVLILCVVFLLMSLGSVGPRGRTRAKEFICRSHLRQWGPIFKSATQDEAGFFLPKGSAGGDDWWVESLWPYHRDEGLFACPTATDVSADVPATHRAWTLGTHAGSLGLNGWIHNSGTNSRVHGNRVPAYCWKTLRTGDAYRIPMLADMCWTDAWPLETNTPPVTEESISPAASLNEMPRVCVNRHDGGVSILFMDGSVRKAGLKELWTLKWFTSYNPRGPWTKAGGVTPADWPQWMRGFKEF